MSRKELTGCIVHAFTIVGVFTVISWFAIRGAEQVNILVTLLISCLLIFSLFSYCYYLYPDIKTILGIKGDEAAP